MVTLFSDKKDCCGCGACMNICPKHAISMQEDEYGFLYPKIENEKCIGCQLCKKTCAYQNHKVENEAQKVYVAQATTEIINKSASGGIFACLAHRVIEAEGIVCGVALEYVNGKLVPRHIAITNDVDLIRIQGSKYVQSNIGTIYTEVKKALLSDKIVLFSGTPCQVDGLKSYLGKKYRNLFCIDIICHGVPNSRFFQDYIAILEKKYSEKIIDFKFRDKVRGWGLTANAYTANANNIIIPCEQSSYYDIFLNSYNYRINCYTCKYANKNRVGDITIGDYWCVENEHPELFIRNGGKINEKLGVSCVIVNNEHGTDLLKVYGNDLFLYESTYEQAAKYNDQLNRPCILNIKLREKVLKEYKEQGYQAVEKIYEHYVMVRKAKQGLKNALKFVLPRYVIDILKKLKNKDVE